MSYSVVVAGRDITSIIDPILIDLNVTLASGSVTDTAQISIDDADGRVIMPRDGAEAVVSLGGTEVFRGKVNDLECTGSKSAGRIMSISCSSMDTNGKSKEPLSKHFDNKKIGEIFEDLARAAGFSQVSVSPSLASTVLPYFAVLDESLIHAGQRLAWKFGGTFKLLGDRAVLKKRGDGLSISGKPLFSVRAAWGENLIDWSVKPVIGRPRHKAVKSRWYDRDEAKWKTVEKASKDSSAPAGGRSRFAQDGEPQAASKAQSEADESDRNKGGGTVTIDGNALAQPEANLILKGARPGIDGTYLIDTVTHSFSKGDGFTTSIGLKQPDEKVGKDNRNG